MICAAADIIIIWRFGYVNMNFAAFCSRFLFQMTTQMHIFGFLLVPFIESRCRDYDAPVLEAFPEKIFFGSRLASCIEETKRGIAERPGKW